uniref:Transposase domain-containing protein n=1 Tax=Anopheles atroparvus TaxID=41427 RepID=A0AAG5DR72_ANOAO
MGKHSCLKCCCEGETVEQRTVFLDTNANKRTDGAFRNKEYVLHQTGSTPLVDLENFDIIEDIVVGDRLHQIDIGVTKKLLNIWYIGVLRSTKRWNREQREIIHHRLKRQTFPFETQRKLRSLDDLSYWKGAECKAFLHYAAPVVLKGLLTGQQYQHFMLYFCGVTIFSSTVHRRLYNAGRAMLKKFVENYAQVYGKAGVTPNVHSLIHIFEEATRLGSLESYSTYVFERKLGQIKNNLIRTSYRCLEQAIRRILELENFNFPRKRQPFCNPFYKQRGQTITLCIRQGFTMRNDDVNDWFLSKDEEVYKFISVRRCQGGLRIICRMFSRVFEYFDQEISSMDLFIFSAKITDLQTTEMELECSDIKCKLVKTIEEEGETMVFFPLLRTLVE